MRPTAADGSTGLKLGAHIQFMSASCCLRDHLTDMPSARRCAPTRAWLLFYFENRVCEPCRRHKMRQKWGSTHRFLLAEMAHRHDLADIFRMCAPGFMDALLLGCCRVWRQRHILSNPTHQWIHWIVLWKINNTIQQFSREQLLVKCVVKLICTIAPRLQFDRVFRNNFTQPIVVDFFGYCSRGVFLQHPA
jgi:hypothetical protein